MRLTRKLKDQFIDRAKEEVFRLTGIRISSCMVTGNGPDKVLLPMTQSMTTFMNGNISCCVEGDRYYTNFYCDNLPDWMTNPHTDGQTGYPDVAIPKDRYDMLKAIADRKIRINAVDEWNDLLEQYNNAKSIRSSHATLQDNVSQGNGNRR